MKPSFLLPVFASGILSFVVTDIYFRHNYADRVSALVGPHITVFGVPFVIWALITSATLLLMWRFRFGAPKDGWLWLSVSLATAYIFPVMSLYYSL